MIPLRDDIRSRRRPFVLYAILGINIAVFLYELSLGSDLNGFISRYGAIPYFIFHPRGLSTYLTIFTSMFMHAGILHIGFNMLFLWVFGDNIEDRMGHIIFIFFYLVTGTAGALLHSVTVPNSTVPMVGASGAISGILGAYIILYPKARVLALVPIIFFFRVIRLPAIIFLGIWFLYQLLSGVATSAAGGGVAYLAHIGGFIAGIVFALPFIRKKKRNHDYVIY
jgi:membrane associated rhomboid family serine protease